jgi:lysozyme family protein
MKFFKPEYVAIAAILLVSWFVVGIFYSADAHLFFHKQLTEATMGDLLGCGFILVLMNSIAK